MPKEVRKYIKSKSAFKPKNIEGIQIGQMLS